MPTQLLAKLIDITYKQVQPDVSQHEIESQLLDNLLGKSLNFSTKKRTQATIEFHNIGQGERHPSTTVALQVKGVEFSQEPDRLSLDLRYIFYKQYANDFHLGSEKINFLIESPFVRKLGPENILIKFAVYGNTVGHINRSLSIFADLIRSHQADLHQTAIDWYDNRKEEWDSNLGVELEKPIENPNHHAPQKDDILEAMYERGREEAYIEEYIDYIHNPHGDAREVIDKRNTYARTEL